MHSLLTVISLGLDSFVACAVIGMTSLRWRERSYLACGFGAWDAFGSLLGSITLHGSYPLAGLSMFGFAALLYVRHLRRAPCGRWPLFLLPILFSLDNLLTWTPVTMVPLTCLSSATMAFLGLSLGAGLRRVAITFLAPTRFAFRSIDSRVQ